MPSNIENQFKVKQKIFMKCISLSQISSSFLKNDEVPQTETFITFFKTLQNVRTLLKSLNRQNFRIVKSEKKMSKDEIHNLIGFTSDKFEKQNSTSSIVKKKFRPKNSFYNKKITPNFKPITQQIDLLNTQLGTQSNNRLDILPNNSQTHFQPKRKLNLESSNHVNSLTSSQLTRQNAKTNNLNDILSTAQTHIQTKSQYSCFPNFDPISLMNNVQQNHTEDNITNENLNNSDLLGRQVICCFDDSFLTKLKIIFSQLSLINITNHLIALKERFFEMILEMKNRKTDYKSLLLMLFTEFEKHFHSEDMKRNLYKLEFSVKMLCRKCGLIKIESVQDDFIEVKDPNEGVMISIIRREDEIEKTKLFYCDKCERHQIFRSEVSGRNLPMILMVIRTSVTENVEGMLLIPDGGFSYWYSLRGMFKIKNTENENSGKLDLERNSIRRVWCGEECICVYEADKDREIGTLTVCGGNSCKSDNDVNEGKQCRFRANSNLILSQAHSSEISNSLENELGKIIKPIKTQMQTEFRESSIDQKEGINILGSNNLQLSQFSGPITIGEQDSLIIIAKCIFSIHSIDSILNIKALKKIEFINWTFMNRSYNFKPSLNLRNIKFNKKLSETLTFLEKNAFGDNKINRGMKPFKNFCTIEIEDQYVCMICDQKYIKWREFNYIMTDAAIENMNQFISKKLPHGKKLTLRFCDNCQKVQDTEKVILLRKMPRIIIVIPNNQENRVENFFRIQMSNSVYKYKIKSRAILDHSDTKTFCKLIGKEDLKVCNGENSDTFVAIYRLRNKQSLKDNLNRVRTIVKRSSINLEKMSQEIPFITSTNMIVNLSLLRNQIRNQEVDILKRVIERSRSHKAKVRLPTNEKEIGFKPIINDLEGKRSIEFRMEQIIKMLKGLSIKFNSIKNFKNDDESLSLNKTYVREYISKESCYSQTISKIVETSEKFTNTPSYQCMRFSYIHPKDFVESENFIEQSKKVKDLKKNEKSKRLKTLVLKDPSIQVESKSVSTDANVILVKNSWCRTENFKNTRFRDIEINGDRLTSYINKSTNTCTEIVETSNKFSIKPLFMSERILLRDKETCSKELQTEGTMVNISSGITQKFMPYNLKLSVMNGKSTADGEQQTDGRPYFTKCRSVQKSKPENLEYTKITGNLPVTVGSQTEERIWSKSDSYTQKCLNRRERIDNLSNIKFSISTQTIGKVKESKQSYCQTNSLRGMIYAGDCVLTKNDCDIQTEDLYRVCPTTATQTSDGFVERYCPNKIPLEKENINNTISCQTDEAPTMDDESVCNLQSKIRFGDVGICAGSRTGRSFTKILPQNNTRMKGRKFNEAKNIRIAKVADDVHEHETQDSCDKNDFRGLLDNDDFESIESMCKATNFEDGKACRVSEINILTQKTSDAYPDTKGVQQIGFNESKTDSLDPSSRDVDQKSSLVAGRKSIENQNFEDQNVSVNKIVEGKAERENLTNYKQKIKLDGAPLFCSICRNIYKNIKSFKVHHYKKHRNEEGKNCLNSLSFINENLDPKEVSKLQIQNDEKPVLQMTEVAKNGSTLAISDGKACNFSGGKLRLKCDFCPKTFANQLNVQRHSLKYHNILDGVIYPFKMPITEKNVEEDMKNRERTDTDEANVPIEQGETKTFKSNGSNTFPYYRLGNLREKTRKEKLNKSRWIKRLELISDSSSIIVGLHNVQNSCFINSTAQFVELIPHFRKIVGIFPVPPKYNLLVEFANLRNLRQKGSIDALTYESIVKRIRDVLTCPGNKHWDCIGLITSLIEQIDLLYQEEVDENESQYCSKDCTYRSVKTITCACDRVVTIDQCHLFKDFQVTICQEDEYRIKNKVSDYVCLRCNSSQEKDQEEVFFMNKMMIYLAQDPLNVKTLPITCKRNGECYNLVGTINRYHTSNNEGHFLNFIRDKSGSIIEINDLSVVNRGSCENEKVIGYELYMALYMSSTRNDEQNLSKNNLNEKQKLGVKEYRLEKGGREQRIKNVELVFHNIDADQSFRNKIILENEVYKMYNITTSANFILNLMETNLKEKLFDTSRLINSNSVNKKGDGILIISNCLDIHKVHSSAVTNQLLCYCLKPTKDSYVYVVIFHNANFNDKEEKRRQFNKFANTVTTIMNVSKNAKLIIHVDLNEDMDRSNKYTFLKDLNRIKTPKHNEYLLHNFSESEIYIKLEDINYWKKDHNVIKVSLNFENLNCSYKWVLDKAMNTLAQKKLYYRFHESLLGLVPFVGVYFTKVNDKKCLKKVLKGLANSFEVGKYRMTDFYKRIYSLRIENLRNNSQKCGDMRIYYTNLKKLCKEVKQAPIISVGNTEEQSKVAIQRLREYMCKLYGERKDVAMNLADFKEITVEELEFAILRLKNAKRTFSCDGINKEFYSPFKKEDYHKLIPAFNEIIRGDSNDNITFKSRLLILDKRKTPSEVVELDKTRTITIESFNLAIIEEIMIKRMTELGFYNNIISKSQIGFKKGMSVSIQILRLLKKIKNSIKLKKKVPTIIFFDLRKAYDMVNRKKLFGKIPDEFLVQFKSILWRIFSKQKIFVLNEDLNEFEHLCSPHRGLPQGNKVSCFLFNLYINQALESLENNGKTFPLGYADDIAVLFETEDIDEILKIVNDFMRSLEELDMKLSTGKCIIWPKNKRTMKLCELLNKEENYFEARDSASYLGYELKKRSKSGLIDLQKRKNKNYMLKNHPDNLDIKYLSFKSLIESKSRHDWLHSHYSQLNKNGKAIERIEKNWGIIVKRHFKFSPLIPQRILPYLTRLEEPKSLIKRTAIKLLEKFEYLIKNKKNLEIDLEIVDDLKKDFQLNEDEIKKVLKIGKMRKERKVNNLEWLKKNEKRVLYYNDLFVWKKEECGSAYMKMDLEKKLKLMDEIKKIGEDKGDINGNHCL